jgi:hypothetical protein
MFIAFFEFITGDEEVAALLWWEEEEKKKRCCIVVIMSTKLLEKKAYGLAKSFVILLLSVFTVSTSTCLTVFAVM